MRNPPLPDIAGWDCLDRPEGTAKTLDGMVRDRMKSRSPVDLSGMTVESLDTAAFLKKVRDYPRSSGGEVPI